MNVTLPVDPAFRLDGNTAVISGGSGRIGAAIALGLAEAGARVVAQWRTNGPRIERLMEDIKAAGATARAVRADMTDPAEVAAMFQVATRDYGPPDILVNAVGAYPEDGFLEMPHETWSSVLALNLDSALLCTQRAALIMKTNSGGSIINIASVAGMTPSPAQSHYSVAKAGLLMLTRSAAQELGRYNIRVNAVSPGLIGRPGLRAEWPDGVERWLSRAPLQRLGKADEVARACVFLASPAAAWITGQNLAVDGGVTSSALY